VTDSTTEDELFASWSSFARYPAMLGGTMAGQLVGIVIDAMIGSRTFWLPLVFSVVFEALVGALYTPRGGMRLDARRCARVSWTYSLVLAGVSVPLLGWILASHAEAVAGGIGYSIVTPGFVVALLIGFVAATVGRAALMIAIVTRRR
jgi:hypothetical protein